MARRLRDEGLAVDGVMAIGPLDGSVDDAFALAAATFADVGGTTLSLGMSGDWERGDRTRIDDDPYRVGDFGPRPARKCIRMSMFVKLGSWFKIPTKRTGLYDTERGRRKRNVVPIGDGVRRSGGSVAVLLHAFGDVTEVPTHCAASSRIVNFAGRGPDAAAARRRFYLRRWYTIDGRIQKLADAIYLIVPSGVMSVPQSQEQVDSVASSIWRPS